MPLFDPPFPWNLSAKNCSGPVSQRNITLEEASRVTKIRAARIQEIEAEDFSSFSSLAYAKGFLLIYGKFLDVDVTPYLDAFETSREVSVDGYSYLQDAPSTPPPPIVRRQTASRPALLPFIIAVGVLVLGLYMVKLLLNIQRITPSAQPGPTATAAFFSVTPLPSASPTPEIAAPRALPVESTPASEALVSVTPASTAETVCSSSRPNRKCVGPSRCILKTRFHQELSRHRLSIACKSPRCAKPTCG